MSYLIKQHIVRGEINMDSLKFLPAGLSITAYKNEALDFVFLEINYDSKSSLSAIFPEKNSIFDKLYQTLKSSWPYAHDSFDIQLISLNILLSTTLNTQVLSLVSDDDTYDLSVISKQGSIERLRFKAEDIEVLYENDVINIYPLVTYDNGPIIDLSIFQCTPFTVHHRIRQDECRLHNIAKSELASFLNDHTNILGLGTFDPPARIMNRLFNYHTDHNTSRRSVDISFWTAHLSLLTAALILFKGADSDIMPIFFVPLLFTGILSLLYYFYKFSAFLTKKGRSPLFWNVLSILLFPGGMWGAYIFSFFMKPAH